MGFSRNADAGFVRRLLAQGLILKDATPLNILFRGTQPVLVDVLSIEARELTSPLWNAYGQFMRTFILPMVAYKYLGWPLKASCIRRDGYEPGTLYRALSWMQRLRGPVWSSVTLPVLLENASRKGSGRTGLHLSADAAEDVLRRRLRSLKRMVKKLQPDRQRSRWSDYQETAQHYSESDHRRKEEFVDEALGIARPGTVLDIGANTGTYSRIAARHGATVVEGNSTFTVQGNCVAARYQIINTTTKKRNYAQKCAQSSFHSIFTKIKKIFNY